MDDGETEDKSMTILDPTTGMPEKPIFRESTEDKPVKRKITFDYRCGACGELIDTSVILQGYQPITHLDKANPPGGGNTEITIGGDTLTKEQITDLVNAINSNTNGEYVVALVRPNVKELLDNASRIAEGVMEKEKSDIE